MLYCFPVILEDELLYSAMAHWANNMFSFKNLRAPILQAFGKATATAIHDLPSNLRYFHSHLPFQEDVTLEELIFRHTLFPYYAVTLRSDRKDQVYQLMCEENARGIHSLSGISNSPIKNTNYLRYCPLCVKADIDKEGRPYWHRAHQLPGSLACVTHEVMLETSEIGITNRRTSDAYRFFPLSPELGQQPATILDTTSNFHQMLLRIAKLNLEILNYGLSIYSPDTKEQVLITATRRGYQRHRGKSKLILDLANHFSSEFLDLLGCSLNLKSSNNWARKILNGDFDGLHPLKMALVLDFLGVTLQELRSIPVGSTVYGKGGWPCLNPFCSDYNLPAISDYQLMYRRRTVVTGVFSCKCGYTYAITKDLVDLSKSPSTVNIRSYGSLWEYKFTEVWNDTTLSISAKCAIMGVQAKKLLAYAAYLNLPFPAPGSSGKSTPPNVVMRQVQYAQDAILVIEYRNCVMNTITANPSIDKRTLVDTVGGGICRFLQMHDTTWWEDKTKNLVVVKERQNNQIPRQIFDWAERDKELCHKILVAARQITDIEGRPVRITLARITRLLEKQDSNTVLKKTQGVISSVSFVAAYTRNR